MHISLTLASLVSSASVFTSVVGQTISGRLDCIPAGSYNLCQNLWGSASGVGSETSTLIKTSSSGVSWSTNYTWANNPNNVKSYPNLESTVAKGVQLQNIAAANTVWNWTYTTQSSGLRADVAYDVWTGVPSSGGPASTVSSYEIMIWLSGLGGIQPVGSKVTSGISLAGHTWDLWKGPNSNWQVLSFVSTSEIKNFNANLNEFFKYIVSKQGVPATQYIHSIQAGTEPFTGTANLLTNIYSVSITKA